MAQLKLKDIGMDSMEILYYERQAKRKKAYLNKKKQSTKQKTTYVEVSQIEQEPNTFSRRPRKFLCNMC